MGLPTSVCVGAQEYVTTSPVEYEGDKSGFEDEGGGWMEAWLPAFGGSQRSSTVLTVKVSEK